MIYFLITKRNNFPIRNFLRSRGKHFQDRITIIYYENLGLLRNLKAGTFIFSDFDLLFPPQREIVQKIYEQLSQRYPHLKLFNDPRKVLLRHDLLKKMYAIGLNKFNAAYASEAFDHLRFPVFIREADRHTGPLTELIYNAEEVHRNIRVLKLLGYASSDLLVIEYVNISNDEGLYTKYSAFVLGGTVMPRYLNYGRNWMVKSIVDPNDALMKSKQADVEEYMRTNPHAEWMEKVFQLAGITYGRADYAFLNQEPQLWEINLNPAFVRPPRNRKKDNSQQRLMRDSFYKIFFEELKKIDVESNEIIQLSISDEEVASLKLSFGQWLKEWFHNRLIKKKPHYRVLHFLCFSWARMMARVLK